MPVRKTKRDAMPFTPFFNVCSPQLQISTSSSIARDRHCNASARDADGFAARTVSRGRGEAERMLSVGMKKKKRRATYADVVTMQVQQA